MEYYNKDCSVPPKCCKDKIYKLPTNIKRIAIGKFYEMIDLDLLI